MPVLMGITMMSCFHSRSIPISENIIPCNDSTLLTISDTICIDIDSEMNPMPFVSQIYGYNGQDHYFVLDNSKLYNYNLHENSLESITAFDVVPELNSLSGFRVWNNGIVLYDYKKKTLFVINIDGSLVNKYTISNSFGIDCWGISGTEILGNDEVIYLSGPPSNDSPDKFDRNTTSISLNPLNGEIIAGGIRPQLYSDYSLGNDYFWRVYHTVDDSNQLYISLPASNEIFIFDKEMNFVKKFNMSSRYNKNLIESAHDLNHSEEKRYYLSQDSYGPITYDALNKCIYRIVTHPMNSDNIVGRTLKPFSIVVSDTNGKLLSETPILNTNNSMFYDVIFATARGLYMQIFSEDESKIKFVTFNFTNHEK